MQKFSEDLDDVIRIAAKRAADDQTRYLTLEHFLWGLLKNPRFLHAVGHGFDPAPVIRFLDGYLKKEAQKPDLKGKAGEDPVATIGTRRTVQRAIDHLNRMMNVMRQDPYIEIWKSLVQEEDSDASYIIRKYRILPREIIEEAEQDAEDEALEKNPSDYAENEGEDSYLDRYCTNLSEKVREGGLDPLIGREAEIEKLSLILSRRVKNNALLIGEAGVGKTAIAYGFADFLQSDKVPEHLKGYEVYALDLSALRAGTSYRGDLEERILGLLDELQEKGKVILFADEFHQLLGSRSDSSSAADILKPVLEQGDLRFIGATTYEDLRISESAGASILRRIQKVDVKEPDEEETFRILKGLAPKFEAFHEVTYTDEILRKIITDASRYISERRLPDKAIDVLDESGAEHRLKPHETKAVTAAEVETVVSKLARIPLKKVSEKDNDKLKGLANRLKQKIFGQDHAVEALTDALKLSKSGLSLPGHPIGSFLLAGPTGVGKTELARQIALQMGIEFVRFDMSEYSESYSVSKLLGSAPGYVGYERGGLLTEAVSKTPHCVLLLDEIEKAHPAIYNVLLQVMDYSVLTDASGKKTDFKNVLLLMTTNAGASSYEKLNIGFGNAVSSGNGAEGVKKTFTPEFRNRLDEIIHFNPLGPKEIRLVVDKFLGELSGQLSAKKIQAVFTEALKEHIAKKGYNPRLGARPMNAFIHRSIKRELADMILFGALSGERGASAPLSLTVDVNAEGKITFDVKPK